MRSTSRATAIFVVALTAAVDPGGLSPFGPAKWAVVTVGVFVLLAFAARSGLVIARAPLIALLAFLAWSFVAATLGDDPIYAWLGTPERHWGYAAWLLVALAFAVGHVCARPALAGAVVAAGVAGAWSLVEVAGFEPLALTGAGARPGGPYGSSAYLGAALVLLGPVAVGAAGDRTLPRWWRAASGTVGAAALVGVVASGARAAWIGALAAAISWAALRRRVRERALPRVIATASVVAVAVVVFAFATGVDDRVQSLVTSDRGGVQGRLDEWRVASRVVRSHPVVGVGPEGYRLAFAASVDEEYEQAHGRDPLPDRAHSVVLDVAATLGLPGLALYLALIAVVGRVIVRAIRGADPMTAGAAIGLVAYGVQSLFLFPIAEVDPVAWLLAGVVCGAMVRRTAAAVSFAPGRAAPVFAAAVAAVAVAVGIADLAADRAARAIVAAPAAANDPEGAARLRPDAARYHLVAARAYEAADAFDDAIEALDRARQRSPRDPVVARERGRLLLEHARSTRATDDASAAGRVLAGIVARDPFNAEAHLRLGLARSLAGDAQGAERSWLTAERLAPRSAAAPTNLAIAYARAGRDEEARAAARRAIARDPDAARAFAVLRELDGGGR